MRVVLILVLVAVLPLLAVTGGKQSQLLVRLTWTGMDLDWSLTKIIFKIFNHEVGTNGNHGLYYLLCDVTNEILKAETL